MSGHSIRLRDEPWQRLPWLLPLALLVTTLSQMGFLLLLRQPSTPTPVQRPGDVQVVDPPVPAAGPGARPPSPARRSPAPPKPRAEPPIPRPTPRPAEPRVEAPRDLAPAVEAEPSPPAPDGPAGRWPAGAGRNGHNECTRDLQADAGDSRVAPSPDGGAGRGGTVPGHGRGQCPGRADRAHEQSRSQPRPGRDAQAVAVFPGEAGRQAHPVNDRYSDPNLREVGEWNGVVSRCLQWYEGPRSTRHDRARDLVAALDRIRPDRP